MGNDPKIPPPDADRLAALLGGDQVEDEPTLSTPDLPPEETDAGTWLTRCTEGLREDLDILDHQRLVLEQRQKARRAEGVEAVVAYLSDSPWPTDQLRHVLEAHRDQIKVLRVSPRELLRRIKRRRR